CARVPAEANEDVHLRGALAAGGKAGLVAELPGVPFRGSACGRRDRNQAEHEPPGKMAPPAAISSHHWRSYSRGPVHSNADAIGILKAAKGYNLLILSKLLVRGATSEGGIFGALPSATIISASRFLEVARQFCATAEEGGFRDTEQRGGRAGLAGDGGFDFGEQASLGPLTHVGVAPPRANEIFQQPGDVRPGRGAHGEPGRTSPRRALELTAGGAVRQPEPLRAAARHR